ncbi:MAG: VanZ family protein [Clostridia bacterium]
MRKTIRMIFIVYMLVLAYLLFCRTEDYGLGGYALFNLVPFRTVTRYLGSMGPGNWLVPVANLLGNVILFIPVGMLLPYAVRKTDSWKAMAAVALLFPMVVETLQYVTRTGILDIDDVMLNAMGIILGYLIFRTLKKRRRTDPSP